MTTTVIPIHQILTGEETTTYDYDTRARVDGISSTAGWSRDSITYNTLGSIKNERQNIPGLGLKTISYDYDGSSGFLYDTRGNMTAEPGYQYEWNRQNYLTAIKDEAIREINFIRAGTFDQTKVNIGERFPGFYREFPWFYLPIIV